jgi:nitroimidazol reductase NimA-like FMN-containing flavoprotein (pyridoxamine 5'-phosphate oxidase superfamily)
MAIQLNSDQVWQAIEKELFAVIGMVNAHNEARTVGVVYTVHDHKLYIGTGKETWKARHIGSNPHVSVTIPIAKRILIMPWIKIPQATITFSGKARVIPATEAPRALLEAVFRHMADNQEMIANSCLIEVTPQREFVTYGIGIPLMQMRFPEKARGRAPVE